MRILVFGAGVVGCETAHELYRAGNDVTLLARGKWRKTIANKGLTVKHYGFLHTTTDQIKTVKKLDRNDRYDLIIVVMQYHQVINILTSLSENVSENILLIGNNMSPSYCEEMIRKTAPCEKNIAFGFEGIGGKREKDRVISMYFKPAITLGGLKSALSEEFKKLLKSSFAATPYRLTFEDNMENWLLTHTARILPTAFLCYILVGNLKRASKDQALLCVDATAEAFAALKKLGYSICPVNEEESYITYRNKKVRSLYFTLKSPAGKFVISNHCKNAVNEMTALSNAFDKIKKTSNTPMQAWKKLKEEAFAAFGKDK